MVVKSSTSVDLFENIFENCLMNASGVYCRLGKEINELILSDCGGIISKSCSINKRNGNPEPRYYENNMGTLNSMGLPNEGYEFYMDKIGKFNKPYVISVAGNYLLNEFTILREINKKMLIKKSKIMVEINVSCPNISGKEQLAYNFPDLDFFLSLLLNTHNNHYKFSNLIIGLKLPPYFDPVHFQRLYNVISKYTCIIKFLTAINSVGNALIVDYKTEKTAIKPKKGLGGLGGSYIKPIALSNIWQLYNLFGDSMIIIGCGGITSGKDVFEHILCGASICQIGSQIMLEGPGCFRRINDELLEIMREKNYSTLSDFQGKLKVL
jgi:dihydroorotate dehydrogenase (fumarate)